MQGHVAGSIMRVNERGVCADATRRISYNAYLVAGGSGMLLKCSREGRAARGSCRRLVAVFGLLEHDGRSGARRLCALASALTWLRGMVGRKSGV
jgi:hypothetical protein